jgi:ribosomal protein L11 methyltransferase
MKIHPDSTLFVYEFDGDPGTMPPDTPDSFIGVWNEEEISYLFFTSSEDEYVSSVVHSTGLTLLSRHEVDYADWQEGLPSTGVVAGGVHFVGFDYPNPPTNTVLLDPSVVFGDGAHPTTLSCLRCLQDLVQKGTISSLLDLGTGSGILALAGARLGISRVLAVDRNRLAVQTAQANVAANNFSDVIRIEGGEARFFIDSPHDLVAANLPFHVLRELATLKGVNKHKYWIVSGISAYQGETLEELFFDQGYMKLDHYNDHPWVTFILANSRLNI